LVVGIRLFNKSIKKGGSSLADVQDLVEHDGRKLVDIIQDVIRDTVTASESYTIFF